jgi:hypothetical protein
MRLGTAAGVPLIAVSLLSTSCMELFSTQEALIPPIQLSKDTAFFAGVVKSLGGFAYPGFLHVDPRPLRESALGTQELEALNDVALMRAQVLRSLGIAEIDALNLGPCAGALVPDPNPEDTRGCPGKPMRVAIIGLPHREWSWCKWDERFKRWLERGYWFVDVREEFRSTASTSTSSVYVMRRVGRNWTLVERACQTIAD